MHDYRGYRVKRLSAVSLQIASNLGFATVL